MIFILQAIAIAISLSVDGPMAKYVACILPIIYIIIIGPGVFTLGNEIEIDKLREKLSKNWHHADELAIYMKKYWCALEYAMSAGARQGNCTALSILSIGLAAYYFFKLSLIPPALILAMAGAILYAMSMRVNRPLGIFNDKSVRNAFTTNEQLRDEWRLAATSLIAFSEIFPESQKHKQLAEMVMADELASMILENWKRT